MNIYPDASSLVRITCGECGAQYVSPLYPAGFSGTGVPMVRPLPCVVHGERPALTTEGNRQPGAAWTWDWWTH